MLDEPFKITAVNSPCGHMMTLGNILTHRFSKGNQGTERTIYILRQWAHECTWPHNDKILIKHSNNQE